MQKVIIFVMVFIGGIWFMNNFNYKPSPKEESKKEAISTNIKTPSELRKEQIEKQFSMLDGSHNNTVKEIKKQMKNPNSFEHVKTVYIDREKIDNTIKIICEFRGTNAYNAIVTNRAESIADLDGNIKSFTIY